MNENAFPDLFPGYRVAGIGASAGGLDALVRLLTPLPADVGMAFLVVQHLAPGHESLLAGILRQKTALGVVEAVHGQPLARGMVYVIPPNASMTLSRGRIQLARRDDSLAPHMPIDDLLHSLARELGTDGIGIILSGQGSDGAEGMQAVKGEGGITLAQDSLSANFSSMPLAAADLSEIDFIGSPEQIAGQLLNLAHHPLFAIGEGSGRGRGDALADDELLELFQLLRANCSVDFTHYKRGTLGRRVQRRMGLMNFGSLADYLAFLRNTPAEVKRLYRDILIQVTSFFRDKEVFAGLQQNVLPALLTGLKSDAPLRIWVPGCSSGEEVYSIAICVLECLGSHVGNVRIQIFGTDLSEDALKKARRGQYLDNIERHVSPQRLERFFNRNSGGYQVAKQVRDICIFARHDVARDPPFSHQSLISCRNLLIYFDAHLQNKVIQFFHYALLPHGCLLLGPSENIGKFSDDFQSVNHGSWKVYHKNSAPLAALGNLPAAVSLATARSKRLSDAGLARGDRAPGRKLEGDNTAHFRVVPASIVCDAALQILEYRGDLSSYLLPGLPENADLHRLARPGLLTSLERLLEALNRTGSAQSGMADIVQTDGRIDFCAELEVLPGPLDAGGSALFIIFFKASPAGSRGLFHGSIRHLQSARRSLLDFLSMRNPLIGDLRAELASNREQIRTVTSDYNSIVTMLKASQEDLLSSNEEFQSINEELETAKEELQSSNEELITTNDELNFRNNELNKLNQKLKFAGDYADTIIATMRDPLLVVDTDRIVVRTNTAFLELSNLRADEVIGSNFYQLNAGQWDSPELRRLVDKVLPAKSTFTDHEIVARFPLQNEKTLLLSGKHLSWREQSLILLSFEDITALRQDVNNLLEKVHLKDEFLAMLAHELRNPLEPIRAAMEIWKRGDAGGEREAEAQQIMSRQIRKVVRLVDDLLDVARLTRNSIVLESLPVDFANSVQEAIDGTSYLYQNRHHVLEVLLPQEPMFVQGDAVRLEQIVANLMSNAAKYTPPGGDIRLSLAREGDDAVLVISDNGLGMTAELLPRIFDLFVQAKAGLDRAQGGLGVGLSLVRRLVKEHGGTIDASSAGLHQGSTFTLRLPLLEMCSVPGTEVSEWAPQQASTRSRRILLVDDNLDSLTATSMLLELEGHTIQTAAEGLAAIETARAFAPQIIVLDIGLPGMNGFQLARRLRRLPETSAALIVALSGYATQKDRELSALAGFDHHFEKPVDFIKLRNLLAHHVAHDAVPPAD